MDTANTKVGHLILFREFSQLCLVPGDPISVYFSRLLDITNQLAGTPEAVPEMILRNHIFTTLPKMFKISIKMLQSRADITVHQIMTELKECELNEVLAMKPDAASEALYSQQGGRGGNKGSRGGPGNYRSGGGGNGGRSDQQSQKWCSWCNSNTHTLENCWKKDGNNTKRPRNDT